MEYLSAFFAGIECEPESAMIMNLNPIKGLGEISLMMSCCDFWFLLGSSFNLTH